MRPRHFAEEITTTKRTHNGKPKGFNEASAFRRGNRQAVARGLAEPCASMRPRHFAEEIVLAIRHGGICSGASMRPRHFAEEIPAKVP